MQEILGENLLFHLSGGSALRHRPAELVQAAER